MLSQEIINAIAVKIGINADEFAQAISNEKEVKIELPKGDFYTEEQKATLLDTHGKRKYDEGKSKRDKELFEGKSKEEYLKEYSSKILEDAKIEPNKKIGELKNSIKNLQENVKTLETDKADVLTKFDSYKKRQSLLSEIPANSVGLSNETVLSEMNANGYAFTDEGVTLNGELLKDQKMQNALSRKDVFNQFLQEKNWLKQNKPSRGGGDEFDGNTSNYEQFVEQCKKDGINPAGEEGQARARELAKDNPEFYN